MPGPPAAGGRQTEDVQARRRQRVGDRRPNPPHEPGRAIAVRAPGAGHQHDRGISGERRTCRQRRRHRDAHDVDGGPPRQPAKHAGVAIAHRGNRPDARERVRLPASQPQARPPAGRPPPGARARLPPQLGLDVLGPQDGWHPRGGQGLDVRERVQLLHVDDVDAVARAGRDLARHRGVMLARDGHRAARDRRPDQRLRPAPAADRHQPDPQVGGVRRRRGATVGIGGDHRDRMAAGAQAGDGLGHEDPPAIDARPRRTRRDEEHGHGTGDNVSTGKGSKRLRRPANCGVTTVRA